MRPMHPRLFAHAVAAPLRARRRIVSLADETAVATHVRQLGLLELSDLKHFLLVQVRWGGST